MTNILTQGVRLMKGSPREIGSNEEVVYRLTIPDSWGVPATPTAMEVFDKDGQSITTAVGGTPTISAQIITFILLGSRLRFQHTYYVRITFRVNGLPLSAIGEWRVRL